MEGAAFVLMEEALLHQLGEDVPGGAVLLQLCGQLLILRLQLLGLGQACLDLRLLLCRNILLRGDLLGGPSALTARLVHGHAHALLH